MALTDESGVNVSMPVAPVGYPMYGNGGFGGFGNGDWSWIIILLLFGMFGGYGGFGGGSYARGDNRGNMNTRMSNARRRDSRGRYSGEDGYSRTEDMVMELHELMNEAPEHTKGEFRKFIDRIENMR